MILFQIERMNSKTKNSYYKNQLAHREENDC